MSSAQPTNKSDKHAQQATPEQVLDQVWSLINQRQVKPAQAVCLKINEQYPNCEHGWFATSFLAFQLGQYNLSLEAINNALFVNNNEARWLLHKAHTLLRLQQLGKAKTLAEQLAKQPFIDINFCSELALILNELSCYKLAEKQYELGLLQADLDQHTQAQLLFNLATIQRYLGKITEAENTLDKVLQLRPLDGEAMLLRTSLRKQTVENNHIAALTKTIKTESLRPLVKTQMYYALAKEYEDVERFELSFEALKLGADTRRQNMQYKVENDLTTIAQLQQHFNQTLFAQEHQGFDNDEPIFILGLPRTGSTLVDRILSNHNKVHSAGELNNFALQMMKQIKQQPNTDSSLAEWATKLDFKKLGEDYIKSTRPSTGHTAKFIDKLPLNSLYIGLIHLALPKAKIIYVNRQPMDACYAIYKNLFTNGYPFSYRLTELADYYAAHKQLMQHWQQTLPNVIYQIEYEQLVTNPEQEVRKLLQYCQLDWQSQCIAVEENKTATTTASASQVRQAIHSNSVNKWRNYQSQLAPLKARLESLGVKC